MRAGMKISNRSTEKIEEIIQKKERCFKKQDNFRKFGNPPQKKNKQN